MNKNLQTIISALKEQGLDYRGAFHPNSSDSVPDCGFDVGTVVLVGNIGGAMWPAFEAGRIDEPNALDNWTKRVLGKIANDLRDLEDIFGKIKVFYPSDGPPYMPFQQWAMRADTVYPSPIGALVHTEYGLWHAYRGALVLNTKLEIPEKPLRTSPCDSCEDKPCLHTCPVNAFVVGSYDTNGCAAHMTTDTGDDCLKYGCLARGACPIGPRRPYPEAQTRFHMGIFRDNHALK